MKQNCQKKNQGIAGCGENANSCELSVKNEHQCSSVAIHSQDGKRADQQHSKDAKVWTRNLQCKNLQKQMRKPMSSTGTHFGSLVYVLESALQKQGIFVKWKSQAILGIYLGQSPHHSRNVALVLNWLTGLVSPQFHVQHDHFYQVVREEQQKELVDDQGRFCSLERVSSRSLKASKVVAKR
jgi:hypothetical protein